MLFFTAYFKILAYVFSSNHLTNPFTNHDRYIFYSFHTSPIQPQKRCFYSIPPFCDPKFHSFWILNEHPFFEFFLIIFAWKNDSKKFDRSYYIILEQASASTMFNVESLKETKLKIWGYTLVFWFEEYFVL